MAMISAASFINIAAMKHARQIWRVAIDDVAAGALLASGSRQEMMICCSYDMCLLKRKIILDSELIADAIIWHGEESLSR